ncbi:hypothetical protein MHM88_01385 [Epibacterium sp. MM17-32]|uniref:hypothetical protein n=1 Tax=Epibacterium sp. MM17-32 TaxID=2917734 RepID=UPI001EF58B8D|nr:hypothetical protein [Epibacterium sp. MM17-32]MCG7626442.1 hypothetical protein [Epibacterium sp. MM17-32]
MIELNEVNLARSLPRLQQRFPDLVVDSVVSAMTQTDELVQAVAAAQGISLTEAREEMRDFLYLESLREELTA